MQIKTILRILGLLLMLFSLSMLPPMCIAAYYPDGTGFPFFISFIVTLLTGIALFINFYDCRSDLKSRDGFVIVALFWIVLSFFAAIPLMLAPYPHETLTDAMFEAVSGLTTTGASVIPHIEHLSHAMLYYRQQLQFLGGMGLIVLAIAIMPMLGVGGMQLYQAETPGPFKEQKIAPRIATSAKLLWGIYILLTGLCALCYWLAGMTAFDAIGESFSTVSTGGFSMHDTCFAYYDSNVIELVAAVFMLLGGINFSLHFHCFLKQDFKIYWKDEEARAYLKGLFFIVAFVTISNYLHSLHPDLFKVFVKSVFNILSFSTTTGFISEDLQSWPLYTIILLSYLAIVGGSAASTSGGIKVVRLLLLQKQTKKNLVQMIHPQAVVSIKYGKLPLPAHIFEAVWSFVTIFFGTFFVLVLILIFTGMDFISSFSAVVATLANAGAGFGQINAGFADLNFSSKWVLIFAMLAGRLEIFTLFILFTPSFWKK